MSLSGDLIKVIVNWVLQFSKEDVMDEELLVKESH